MQYSTEEIAHKLDISETSVRTWAKVFDVPHKKSSGRMRFSGDAIKILKVVKTLKDNNSGLETIRRKLENETQETRAGNNPQRDESAISLQALLDEALEKGLSRHSDLSEKYARATYTIGQLEQQVKTFQERIGQLESQVKLLPSPEQWVTLQAENKRQQQCVKDVEAPCDQLKQKPNRPWWKFWS